MFIFYLINIKDVSAFTLFKIYLSENIYIYILRIRIDKLKGKLKK
jgi:hypothetical protein